MHVQPGGQAQFIQSGVVEDAGGDDRDAVAVFRQRHQAVVQQNAGGEFGEKFLGRGVFDAVLFQIDEGHVEIAGQRAEDFVLGRRWRRGGRRRAACRRWCGGADLRGLGGIEQEIRN